jgi:hypothetical protein
VRTRGFFEPLNLPILNNAYSFKKYNGKKAVVYYRYGSPEVLRVTKAPKSAPQKNEKSWKNPFQYRECSQQEPLAEMKNLSYREIVFLDAPDYVLGACVPFQSMPGALG